MAAFRQATKRFCGDSVDVKLDVIELLILAQSVKNFSTSGLVQN